MRTRPSLLPSRHGVLKLTRYHDTAERTVDDDELRPEPDDAPPMVRKCPAVPLDAMPKPLRPPGRP